MSIKTMTKHWERSQRHINVWQKPKRKTLPTKKRRSPFWNRELASWRNLFRREGKSSFYPLYFQLLPFNQPSSKNHLSVMVHPGNGQRNWSRYGVTLDIVISGLPYTNQAKGSFRLCIYHFVWFICLFKQRNIWPQTQLELQLFWIYSWKFKKVHKVGEFVRKFAFLLVFS